MKKLTASVLAFIIALMALAGTATAESTVVRHTITGSNFPLYFASEKLDREIPLKFVDDATDLPYIEANDLRDLLIFFFEEDYLVSPAECQKHRKFNVQRPFCGIISTRKINKIDEKPCTCRRPENVQTAHWTGVDAGITRNVRLIAA